MAISVGSRLAGCRRGERWYCMQACLMKTWVSVSEIGRVRYRGCSNSRSPSGMRECNLQRRDKSERGRGRLPAALETLPCYLSLKDMVRLVWILCPRLEAHSLAWSSFAATIGTARRRPTSPYLSVHLVMLLGHVDMLESRSCFSSDLYIIMQAVDALCSVLYRHIVPREVPCAKRSFYAFWVFCSS